MPLDDNGYIEVSLAAAAAMNGTVNVDLVGWYGAPAGGVSYHPLPQKLAYSGTLNSTPVDLQVLAMQAFRRLV